MDANVNEYIEEIKKKLPKNMKKEKIDFIENMINNICQQQLSNIKTNNDINNRKNNNKVNIDNTFIEKNINYILLLKEINKILINYDIKYNFLTYSEYIKMRNKDIFEFQIKYPDLYFINIGRSICISIKNNVENIYNMEFIKKENILEETISAWSLKVKYIDEFVIQEIKIIVHIIQYTLNKCFLKIMPFSNTTNKSIYINIENNIEHKMSNLKIED